MGSTEYIIKALDARRARLEWAVGTELNLVRRLANAHPDKQIVFLDKSVCYKTKAKDDTNIDEVRLKECDAIADNHCSSDNDTCRHLPGHFAFMWFLFEGIHTLSPSLVFMRYELIYNIRKVSLQTPLGGAK